MPYLPGLDGLRGLAVIGAILFHAGFTWAKGGFLGVSTFFVLSGFLITNLLIREWDASGNIRLSRFWMRRFRRLLPAALLTLLAVALIWWRLGAPEQLASLRWDLLTSLAYVANWHFYFAGSAYANLLSAPSPLQHFWSLAIEEQFYIIFPPTAIALLGVGGRRLLVLAICTATVASIGLAFGMANDFDRIYYGTDTRAAELLVGALLGLWWSSHYRQTKAYNSRLGDKRIHRQIVDFACIATMACMFWCWNAVDISSRALTQGGFFYMRCSQPL
jgi:peptidoglycan/LPS O-acetylase OafA/YrhL